MQEQITQQKAADLALLEAIIIKGCRQQDSDAKLLVDLSFTYPYYAMRLFVANNQHPCAEVAGYHRKCCQAANVIVMGALTTRKKVLTTIPQTDAEHQRKERLLQILEPILAEEARWN